MLCIPNKETVHNNKKKKEDIISFHPPSTLYTFSCTVGEPIQAVIRWRQGYNLDNTQSVKLLLL